MAPVLVAAERPRLRSALDARRREHLVVVLAVVSGVTDAAGFIGLGGAFSSVMTGNMVLLGLSGGTGNGSLAARAGAAIAAFVLGCVVGTRLASHKPAADPKVDAAGSNGDAEAVWPASVTRALIAEFAVICMYAVVLQMVARHPLGGVVKTALLAFNAVALGIQSSAIQRFGVPGLSTTYLTGTLTTTIVHLSSRRPIRHVALNVRLLMGLVGGAVVGGLVAEHAMRYTPALQLLGLGAVIACAAVGRASRDGTVTDSN